jgi:hypothetical protein
VTSGRVVLVAALVCQMATSCAEAEGIPAARARSGSPESPDAGTDNGSDAAGAGTGGTSAGGTSAGGTSAGGTSAAAGTAGASAIDGGSTGGSEALGSGGGDADAPNDPCTDACNGHGVCTNTTQGPTCACDEGFDAPDCFTRNADYGRRLKLRDNLADPNVIKFSDERYVLSGTGSGTDFAFLESSDLVTWNQVATYNPSAADPSYDYCFCWAPELAQVDGTLYLYFSAYRGPQGMTTCPPPTGSDVTTFRAASPDGSLSFGKPELLFQGQAGAQSRTQAGCPTGGCGLAIRIDPAVYAGRLYYVFFDQGNNVGSVSLTNPSDFRMHAGPSGWALDSYEESINEAPALLERAGRAYLFFSAAWYNSQYATFYVMGSSAPDLTRDLPIRRLTTPARRGNGNLIETHGHNSIVTRRGETFNFFHVGVFDAAGSLIRRDTYRQRIAWNDDGSAISQNQVQVSWNSIGGGNSYSLDLVLRNGSVIGPCIAVGRIGQNTSTAYVGVCPDAGDRLVHKSEVKAFRLYASPTDYFVQVGETQYDGYSDLVHIQATAP